MRTVNRLAINYKLRTKTPRGFTLIEFLMYMGVFSFVLVALTTMFGAVIDSGLESRAVSSTQQDGRYIILKLTYDIQNAQNIVAPTLGSTSSSLQLITGGVTSTYQLDASGNLTLTDASGTNTLNSYDASISAMTFQRLGNASGKNTVQVLFTATGRSSSQKGAEVVPFQSTIALR